MVHYAQVGSILSLAKKSASVVSTKLYVGGLSFGTDASALRNAFAKFGEVADAKVMTDEVTGKSRGFGYVKYADYKSANSAASAMDGQELGGRSIRVNIC